MDRLIPSRGQRLSVDNCIIEGNAHDVRIIGSGNRVYLNHASVEGEYNDVSGSTNKVMGRGNIIRGSCSVVVGSDNTLYGTNHSVIGPLNRVASSHTYVQGNGNTIDGAYCAVLGNMCIVRATDVQLKGSNPVVEGDNLNFVWHADDDSFSPIDGFIEQPVAFTQERVVSPMAYELPSPSIDKKAPAEPITCPICFENQPSIVFSPCQHAVLCARCFNSLPKVKYLHSLPAKNCPICRQKIEKWSRLILP
jgi:hypothetical protein